MYRKKVSRPWLSRQYNENGDLQREQNEVHSNELKEKNSSGDKWDQVGLKELLKGKHKKLFAGESKFQDIKVVEATDIRMYLNEQLQFSSLDERIYHEAFVHIPFALTRKHNRVLILGGGDGLALREVLKYEDVLHVDLVDLDELVLDISRNIPELAKINNRAFFDKRVHVFAEDALKYVHRNKQEYDLIIVDFPDPSVELLANLYTVEFYQQLYDSLSIEGMIVCQANAIDETPIVFWSIGKTFEAAKFYTDAYHTVIPSFGDWGFQLAAKKPFSTHINNIYVPHRTLPTNISAMFKIHPKLYALKRRAEVNRKERLVLHKIFQREIGEY